MNNVPLKDLKFDANGLVPAIIQDADTGQVLMFAFMNDKAVELTRTTGKAHFYSRSRDKLWLKGESSGHTQDVVTIDTDCDKDVLLVRVRQNGAACHDGYYSCFYRRYEDGSAEWNVIGDKRFDPEKVYR